MPNKQLSRVTQNKFSKIKRKQKMLQQTPLPVKMQRSKSCLSKLDTEEYGKKYVLMSEKCMEKGIEKCVEKCIEKCRNLPATSEHQETSLMKDKQLEPSKANGVLRRRRSKSLTQKSFNFSVGTEFSWKSFWDGKPIKFDCGFNFQKVNTNMEDEITVNKIELAKLLLQNEYQSEETKTQEKTKETPNECIEIEQEQEQGLKAITFEVEQQSNDNSETVNTNEADREKNDNDNDNEKDKEEEEKEKEKLK